MTATRNHRFAIGLQRASLRIYGGAPSTTTRKHHLVVRRVSRPATAAPAAPCSPRHAGGYNPRVMKTCGARRKPGVSRGLDLLVYRLPPDRPRHRLVVWGGGNTSIKLQETDFRDRKVRVMRIKGAARTSGRESRRSTFPGIRLDEIEPLLERATR